MIYKNYKNIRLSTLGMGNMRLPLNEQGQGKTPINYAEAHKIIDRAYASGINYYDTAYVYNNGDSEACLGEAMKKYPRDSFYLATKFNLGANPDYKAVFETQRKRLQTDYIDFYLFHCLSDNTMQDFIDCGAIEYFFGMKEQGKITNFGFSSHASPATLKKFVSLYPWDFVQIQLNYFDWLFGTAKEEYEILREKNIPIIVMEPVRGGRLSSLTPEAEKLLKSAHPDWSISSWALRFVRSLPGVQVILSGMSTLDQVDDNVTTFSDTEAFTEADQKVLFEACAMFRSQVQVPCTSCRYCTDGCPAKINIPEFLNLYNDYKVNGSWGLGKARDIKSSGIPADCIGCGSCTKHCPQKIDTPKIMAELNDLLRWVYEKK